MQFKRVQLKVENGNSISLCVLHYGISIFIHLILNPNESCVTEIIYKLIRFVSLEGEREKCINDMGEAGKDLNFPMKLRTFLSN